ncbi:MAG: hypothetical protein KatS3mg105_3834 [Gemmatales bacterium]|nr:MAG: hypothetical protein KatS3mg105_3834 [Gemmatales bacterium]
MFAEIRQHLLHHQRINRCRRIVVQINRFHVRLLVIPLQDPGVLCPLLKSAQFSLQFLQHVRELIVIRQVLGFVGVRLQIEQLVFGAVDIRARWCVCRTSP